MNTQFRRSHTVLAAWRQIKPRWADVELTDAAKLRQLQRDTKSRIWPIQWSYITQIFLSGYCVLFTNRAKTPQLCSLQRKTSFSRGAQTILFSSRCLQVRFLNFVLFRHICDYNLEKRMTQLPSYCTDLYSDAPAHVEGAKTISTR